MLVTRDHMDLGSSICDLGGVGEAHHFHSRNLDPDAERRVIDDPYTPSISWPNFHSGANGDYQPIEPVLPIHPVLKDEHSPTGALRYLPAHPHEGDVDAPGEFAARVIARGKSLVTGHTFNLAVAFEADARGGRAIAQSTFPPFCRLQLGSALRIAEFCNRDFRRCDSQRPAGARRYASLHVQSGLVAGWTAPVAKRRRGCACRRPARTAAARQAALANRPCRRFETRGARGGTPSMSARTRPGEAPGPARWAR